jgi:hypothetical protein
VHDPLPLEESGVETVTEGLRKIDKDTVLVFHDEAIGKLHYQCPVADESELNTLGDLFKIWMGTEDDVDPTIIGY